MPQKSVPDIKAVCTECGYKPAPDKEKSNENFEVFPVKCPKCGGRIKFEIG